MPMDNEVNFDTQYCASYNARYSRLYRMVLDNPEVTRRGLEIKELKDDISTECLVVAIFFLKSGAKPSVLKENNDVEKKRIDCYINDSPVYHVQDKSGNLELTFTPDFDKLPAFLTGMVLGFVGKLTTRARFECCDVIFPCPLKNQKYALAGSAHRVLIAGNCLVNHGNIEKLKVIADYCRDKVSALVLIGDNFAATEDTPRTDLLEMWAMDMRMDVFLVPGLNDPTTRMLPQYPLHPLLFSKNAVGSATNSSGYIFPLQNPGRTKIANADFVVLSHHIMDELVKYVPKAGSETEEKDSSSSGGPLSQRTSLSTSVDEPLFMSLLEQLVKARHLVPNAPDTLSCVPYSDCDPFILEECDVLVAGGCKSACSRIFKGCAVVGVPDFDATNAAVLFSLGDASVEEIICPDLSV